MPKSNEGLYDMFKGIPLHAEQRYVIDIFSIFINKLHLRFSFKVILVFNFKIQHLSRHIACISIIIPAYRQKLPVRGFEKFFPILIFFN